MREEDEDEDEEEEAERKTPHCYKLVLVNSLYVIVFLIFCKHCIENTYGNIFFL